MSSIFSRRSYFSRSFQLARRSWYSQQMRFLDVFILTKASRWKIAENLSQHSSMLTSIMMTRKLISSFELHHRRLLLSHTNSWASWSRSMIITRVSSARASLVFLSVLNVAFMNKARLISKFDSQCSCLGVSMTRHSISKSQCIE